MASATKNFVFKEVSKHNKTKDCWLVINGKVYDVTPFMEDHPGGDEVLLAATGKDATGDFEVTGHSDDAKEMMHKYYIGEVDISTVPQKYTYVPPADDNPDKNTSQFILKILQLMLPLIILALALAFALRSYTKDKSAA